MTTTQTIKALRDALTRIATYPKSRRDEMTGMNCRRIAREALDLANRIDVALTADASEDAPDVLDPVVEANREWLLRRSQFGIRKYGVTLADGNLSERELVTHALEEALDLSNYLQALLQRTAARPAPVAATPAPDVAVLLEVISVLRNYPDFDADDNPMAVMMDEALAGKVPTLLSTIDSLAQGRMPAAPAAPIAADTDENAPWLTLAHMICADAGIPCGHITDRLKALRDKMEAAPIVEVTGAMCPGRGVECGDSRQAWCATCPKWFPDVAKAGAADAEGI